MKFKLVSHGNHQKFEEEVNELLAEGWKFHGTIFLVPGSASFTGITFLHQAFYKES